MSTMALTDTLLMIRVRDGEGEVFDQLVERYRNDLIGFLYRMIDNRAIAEELAQEAFFRAYRSRAGYQPTAKFSTWLYSIGTRLALNWLRDNRQRRHYEPLEGKVDDGPPRQWPDPAPLADSCLLRAELMHSVRHALEQLPDRQRSVVILHRYHDMTYEQIAAAMQCSPQAVKSLLFRAHSALREILTARISPIAA